MGRTGDVVRAVNAFEPEMSACPDEQLSSVTAELRARLEDGATLDELLPRAFAAVREAARRAIGQRHFDEQIAGGAALHRGALVEMKTGEGKTLTVTLPAYLAALNGAGVHVMTATDYLASRDFEWMAPVYQLLGLRCGLVVEETPQEQRRDAYAADVTYGPWQQFAYDYLRSNLAMESEQYVQRGQAAAIVDEADLIMLDEVRTPLMITTASTRPVTPYTDTAQLVGRLMRGIDYDVDERAGAVGLLERGIARIEEQLGLDNLYDSAHAELLGRIDVALRAKELFQRDREYFVEDGRIRIVRASTGRISEKERYDDELQAALEAKENLRISSATRLRARINVREYLKLYARLCGLTGVASTDAKMYQEIYGLDVVEIPTHQPVRRVDLPATFQLDDQAHLSAIVTAVAARHAEGRPVLIGTATIADSERISNALTARDIQHEVLNAKQHAREAELIAQAGRLGAVTVVTAMGGRGVDIPLGGDSDADRETVMRLGGLYVLGTALHPTRRLEAQLRGRAGRRGDPGRSEFVLSLQDPVLRSAFSERVINRFARRLSRGRSVDAELLDLPLNWWRDKNLLRTIEKVKSGLAWDAAEAEQRAAVYDRRAAVFYERTDPREIRRTIDEVVGRYVKHAEPGPDGIEKLWDLLRTLFPVSVTPQSVAEAHGLPAHAIAPDVLTAELQADAQQAYDRREAEFGPAILRELERRVVLAVIDSKWSEQLAILDDLLAAARLRVATGGDPLAHYRREASRRYEEMLESVKHDTVGYLFNVEIQIEPDDRAQETA